jgi:hypothetical protein
MSDIYDAIKSHVLDDLSDEEWKKEALLDKELNEIIDGFSIHFVQLIDELASQIIRIAELRARLADSAGKCDGPIMAAPCDGGCGDGIGEHELDGKNYCTGCLIGAYILNTNALRRAKETIKELRRNSSDTA